MACAIFVILVMVMPLALCRRSQSSFRGYANFNKDLRSSTEDQLRIFATTFNAANVDSQSFSPRRVDRLIQHLTDGHEDPGEEADIVVLGFQEFLDPERKFGNEVKNYLWKQLSERNMGEIKDTVNDVLEIPHDVLETKNSLSNDFADFYKKIREQLMQFQLQFGENGDKFHAHLGDSSKLTPWVIQNKTEALQLALGEETAGQKLHDKKALKSQYHDLTESAQNLRKEISTYPNDTHIHNKMKPIHTWITSVTKKLKRIRNKYPNIGHTTKGQKAWDSLITDLKKVKHVEEDLIMKNRHHATMLSDTQGMEDGIKKAVVHEEDLISNRLYLDLAHISDAVKKLTNDIQASLSNGKKDRVIAHTAARGSRPWEHKLDTSMKRWVESTNESFKWLLRPASFRMKRNHFQVGLTSQVLHSGFSCHLLTHYDTMLYVYVNPWSDWEISAVDYTSSTCLRGKNTPDSGCNIDNTETKECGKAVNLLIFKARKQGKSIKICALNTHMSYAGEASQRLQYIKNAVKEATDAQCDTLVFVGDFNSRLHCDATPVSYDKIPPYERLDPKTNSSFRYLVDLICPGGRCALKGLSDKILYYDELMQMMDLEKIYCMEKRKVNVNMFQSQSVWKRVVTDSDLKKMGVFEADVPNWSPTYKLGPRRIMPEVPEEWRFCEENKLNCFRNSDKKGKHNLAWTDRILLWPSKRGKAIPRSTEYTRRSISAEFGSDHIPVVAKVIIKVS